AEIVQSATGNDDPTCTSDVRIGQVHDQQVVVLFDGRTQKKWSVTPQAEDKTGQEPSSFMIEALLTQTNASDVAVVVEDGESVPVLEHTATFIRERGGCQNVEGVLLVGTPRPIAVVAHTRLLFLRRDRIRDRLQCTSHPWLRPGGRRCYAWCRHCFVR